MKIPAKSYRFILLASALFQTACTPESSSELQAEREVLSPVAAKDSASWIGIYRGELPCADCDYIEATIVLRDNLHYSLTTRHVGRVAGVLPSEKRGTFHWRNDGLLQLDAAGDNMVFFAHEKGLQMRGNDGKAYPDGKGKICGLAKTGSFVPGQ